MLLKNHKTPFKRCFVVASSFKWLNHIFFRERGKTYSLILPPKEFFSRVPMTKPLLINKRGLPRCPMGDPP